jgi:hypothetical protein
MSAFYSVASGLDIFPKGWVSELLICRFANAGVVGGRLWLTGFPLCFCEKYGKLARTDLKNERISRSGGFQACYEIIRGVVGGLSPALNLSISTSEPHPLGKMSNPVCVCDGRGCMRGLACAGSDQTMAEGLGLRDFGVILFRWTGNVG